MDEPDAAQPQEYQHISGGHGDVFRSERGQDRPVDQPACACQEADGAHERHEYGRATVKGCLNSGFFAHNLILSAGFMNIKSRRALDPFLFPLPCSHSVCLCYGLFMRRYQYWQEIDIQWLVQNRFNPFRYITNIALDHGCSTHQIYIRGKLPASPDGNCCIGQPDHALLFQF